MKERLVYAGLEDIEAYNVHICPLPNALPYIIVLFGILKHRNHSIAFHRGPFLSLPNRNINNKRISLLYC